VDELQDTSAARAELLKALLKPQGKHLLAVGDDWQSINRFAGADISVMTRFEDHFGETLTLHITQSFRCPQKICDVASRFVLKNPQQDRKKMISANGPGRSVVIVGPPPEDPERGPLSREEERESSLSAALRQIEEEAEDAKAQGKADVLILGRYHFNKEDAKSVLRHYEDHPGLSVRFSTIHAAKGLEADYVVVTGVVSGLYGFPGAVSDDPVLQLAMPTPESFPDSEERRLLYVALTRTRRRAFIATTNSNPSPFIAELVSDFASGGDVTLVNLETGAAKLCPLCRKGALQVRRGNGNYPDFLSCSSFPACEYKQDAGKPVPATVEPARTAAPSGRPKRTTSRRRETVEECSACEIGVMRPRKGKYGRFLGCSRYPKCTNTRSL
jgi:DNA helicase IV